MADTQVMRGGGPPVKAQALQMNVDGRPFDPDSIALTDDAVIRLRSDKNGRAGLHGHVSMVISDSKSGIKLPLEVHLECKPDQHGVVQSMFSIEPAPSQRDNPAAAQVCEALNSKRNSGGDFLYATDKQSLTLRLGYTFPSLPFDAIDNYMAFWVGIENITKGLASRSRQHSPKLTPKNLHVTKLVLSAARETRDAKEQQTVGRNVLPHARELTNRFRMMMREMDAIVEHHDQKCRQDPGYKSAMVALMKDAVAERETKPSRLDKHLMAGGYGPRGMRMMIERSMREWDRRSSPGILFRRQHDDEKLMDVFEASYKFLDDLKRAAHTLSIGIEETQSHDLARGAEQEQRREPPQDRQRTPVSFRHQAAHGGQVVRFPERRQDVSR